MIKVVEFIFYIKYTLQRILDMLQNIIKGNVESIAAKLELKLDEYFELCSKEYLTNFYTHLMYDLDINVPNACSYIFENDLFPKSNSHVIYGITKSYKYIFIKLGSTLDEYELANNTTRKILINKASLALLMLIYNNNFREFCNVKEKRQTIFKAIKMQYLYN